MFLYVFAMCWYVFLHRKIMRKYRNMVGFLLGNLYGTFLEIIGLKAPGNYSASIWSYSFSICLWERLKTFISMISGFSDVSPSPGINYFHLLRHQDTLTKSRRSQILSECYYFHIINIKKWTSNNNKFWRRRALETPEDPFNKFLKILDTRSIFF